MFAPKYVSVTPMTLFDEVSVQTVGSVHGFGYHPLTTTHLAQKIKQLVPILDAHNVVQHLESMLVWHGDSGILRKIPSPFYR